MKVSLEDAVCIALAVTMVSCLVFWQAVIVPALVATFAVWEGLTAILGAFAIAGTGFMAVVRMPSRWYFEIIYDSTDGAVPCSDTGDISIVSSDDVH